MIMISSVRDLIPRRRERLPENCNICFEFVEADRLGPDGTWVQGRTFTSKQVPGRWIQWLGRKWFWKEMR